MSKAVKGNRTLQSANSPYNALSFMIKTLVEGMIHTAEVVRVVKVEGGGSGSATGYVDVLPLVCQVAADNTALRPAVLYRLPYARMQGGVAALVVDPVPGDIGIAVFAKRDSTNVQAGTEEPVQPGSYRCFDQADGFYVGGFLNQAPSIFLELDQNNNATLTAPNSVTVNTDRCTIKADSSVTIDCKTFTVNASQSAGINAPSWSFNTYDGTGRGRGTINADLTQTGNYSQTGNLTQNGTFTHTGAMNQTGSITSSGDHVAGGVSLKGHVHGGVQGGNGTTGTPV